MNRRLSALTENDFDPAFRSFAGIDMIFWVDDQSGTGVSPVRK